MATWLVEVRLHSRLGVDRAQLDRLRSATASLRPRVFSRRPRRATIQLVIAAPSELAAVRAADAAVAVALDAVGEIGWETEVVTRLD